MVERSEYGGKKQMRSDGPKMLDYTLKISQRSMIKDFNLGLVSIYI